MKICAAQTRPHNGDVTKNIEQHKQLIDLAIDHKADLILFPELSITGYEPEMAKELAMEGNDARLAEFQKIANSHQVSIGVGFPTMSTGGVCISTAFYQPFREAVIYSKKYLHHSEDTFFVSGDGTNPIEIDKVKVGLAICYELSVPQRAKEAFENGAEVYLASVVEPKNVIEKTLQTLSDTASAYSAPVVMANCTGMSGGYDCAGRSSVWNDEGHLLDQLEEDDLGIIMIETDTNSAKKVVI